MKIDSRSLIRSGTSLAGMTFFLSGFLTRYKRFPKITQGDSI
jgi:hypothetical protein